MKNQVLVLIILVLCSALSQAWQLQEQVKRAADGQLGRSFVAQCQAGESFCQQLCDNANSCEVAQDSCVSCVSDTDLALRSVLSDANQIYQMKPETVKESSLIHFFQQSNFLMMSATSMLNVFLDPQDPKDADQVRSSLQKFCDNPTDNPIVIFNSKQNSNWAPVAIVCNSTGAGSQVIPLRFNPGFSSDNNQLDSVAWETEPMQNTVADAPSAISLRMTMELEPALAATTLPATTATKSRPAKLLKLRLQMELP